VAASYEEFVAKHRDEHRSAFIRWATVIGNYSNIPTAIWLLAGRRRRAATSFAFGTAALVIGHSVEGNLARAGRDLARHPIWSVRADVALATTTLRDGLRQMRSLTGRTPLSGGSCRS
jgi:hypothetical protein